MLACAATALLLGGVAGAANPTAFTDRSGDAGSGPDITRLEVSSEDGWLSFWVTVAGRHPCGELGGVHVIIALDLDQTPDTGSAFYGTEVELVSDNEGLGRSAPRERLGLQTRPPAGGVGERVQPDGRGL